MDKEEYLENSKANIYNINECNTNNIINDKFLPYKKRVYSQLEEDGIIEYIFSIIKPNFKYYVEFGAGDGIWCSNTANLRLNKGWNGLLLEADETKVNSCKDKNKINLHTEYISKDNINKIFTKYEVPMNLDFLSIDIDSNDYYVWEALTDFRPRVVVVETNPGIKNDLPLAVINDKGTVQWNNYFGANLHAFYDLAKRKGYELLTVELYNAFFIVKEEFEKFDIEPITKDIMLSKYCISEKFWIDRIWCQGHPGPFQWKVV